MSPFQKHSTLARRFGWALRGIGLACARQANMQLHLGATVLVIAAGAALGIDAWEWLVVIGCIGLVIVAECFNSALEALGPAVTEEYNEHLRDALDISAGGVLLAALIAAVVGGLVIGRHLAALCGWS